MTTSFPRSALANHDGQLERVDDQVAVGQHRPLRRPGRSPGVLQQRHVVLARSPRAEAAAGASRAAARGRRCRALGMDDDPLAVLLLAKCTIDFHGNPRRLGDVDHDDALDRGLLLGSRAGAGRTCRAGRPSRRRQSSNCSFISRGDVERIRVHRDRAEAQQAEEHHRELRAVREHDRDAVALANAQLVAARSRSAALASGACR